MAKEITWNCRWGEFHEVGCPHQEWSKEELLKALITKKRFEQSIKGKVLTKDLAKELGLHERRVL